MSKRKLEELWDDVREPGPPFDVEEIVRLPEPAQRYLLHSIAPGTPRPHAMRIQADGEIKLDGEWWPFEAEQVTHTAHGFVWAATAKVKGLPVKGYDRLIDGEAAMRWRLLGIVPVVSEEGVNIARSALGRVEGEAVWMPSMLLPPGVQWDALDDTHADATISVLGHTNRLDIELAEGGRPLSVGLLRWGNPEGEEHHFVPFGAVFEEESTFGGFTIPTKFRVGWYFGADNFESEGVFFRGVIRDIEYR